MAVLACSGLSTYWEVLQRGATRRWISTHPHPMSRQTQNTVTAIRDDGPGHDAW